LTSGKLQRKTSKDSWIQDMSAERNTSGTFAWLEQAVSSGNDLNHHNQKIICSVINYPNHGINHRSTGNLGKKRESWQW